MHFHLVSFLTPRWRGQVFELFRSPVRFSQLSWRGRDGWLPSFGFLQGLVVLCLLDSSDLKFPLRRACLESSSFCVIERGGLDWKNATPGNEFQKPRIVDR